MKVDVKPEFTETAIGNLTPGDCFTEEGSMPTIGIVINAKPVYGVDSKYPVVAVSLTDGRIIQYQEGYPVAKRDLKVIESDD